MSKICRHITIGLLLFCSLLLASPYHSSHFSSPSAQAWVDLQQNNNQEVVVALIDSGFGTADLDPTSYSLWENRSEIEGISGVDDDNNGFVDDFHGWDWVDDDNVMDDLHGHGTQSGETMLQIVEKLGVDRHVVRILPLRILSEHRTGRISDVVDAINYAVDQGVPIINLSLSLLSDHPKLESAIHAAYEAGILVITPTYNWCMAYEWPSEYDETFAVVSTAWLVNDYCSRTDPDIAVNMDSIEIEVSTVSSSSLSTFYVTATAALLHLQNPGHSSEDIRSIILSTADDTIAEFPVLNIEVALGLDKHKLYLPFITK